MLTMGNTGCLPCTMAKATGGYPRPVDSAAAFGMVAPIRYASGAPGTPDATVGQVSTSPAIFAAAPSPAPCGCGGDRRRNAIRFGVALLVVYLLARR
jgi:hypothetical protein